MKQKKSRPFWIDSLTLASWKSKKDVPSNIPESRLEHWDSIFEYSFYRQCKKIPDVVITRQESLLLLEETPLFPELRWKIDFVINGMYVECKGSWIEDEPKINADFIKTLRLFQNRFPRNFERFVLVGDKEGRLGNTNIPIITPDSAIQIIKTGKTYG